MRRSTISWLAVFVLIFGGFAATVAALNSSLYSAQGFVRTYLDALAQKDSAAALAIPGVSATTAGEGVDALLHDSAMSGLGDYTLVRDTEETSGIHTVVFDVVLDGETARTEFHVERSGTRFGLYPTWSFAASPLSTLSVTVEHADGFEVNGSPVVDAGAYLVFAPGSYVVDHASTYLEADAATARVSETGTIVDSTITATPTAEFVDAVQTEVDGFLDKCVTQTVLQPTGCPFGRDISNRVTDAPRWSIVDYPKITLAAGEKSGSWIVSDVPATAHLVATVQSLFDGTISTFDEDVPFTVAYAITIDGADLSINAR